MQFFRLCAPAVVIFGLAGGVQAADLTLPVPVDGVRQTTVDYTCEGGDTMRVVYVNAGQNSLAIVPQGGEKIIFANVLSGSGARYAAGSKIWWSHQGEATLSDIRSGDGIPPAITCKEMK